jgi:hypothetical protein
MTFEAVTSEDKMTAKYLGAMKGYSVRGVLTVGAVASP